MKLKGRILRRLWLCGVVLAVAGAAATVPPEALEKIRAAIPSESMVAPAKPRRLLIYEANVGYGGHPSAAYAAEAFRQMGRRTGAYETELSGEPEVFRAESLARFDAVFLNNCVGNLFTEAALRESLLGFVLRGGGLLGVHGTAVAFTQWPGAIEDWPEFGVMLGGRGANHRDSDEHVFMRIEDPAHPLTSCFDPAGFDFRDEFFRVHEPYSRSRVRVLLSFDTERTDMQQGPDRGWCIREDNDYAVAWMRSYGRGRTFYCTIAHNPYVFWDRQMLRFYLGAIQWALGDVQASTVPSALVSPAIRAEELLGWRVGVLGADTKAAAAAAVPYFASRGGAVIGVEGGEGKAFDLSGERLTAVRLGFDAAGVRLIAHDLTEEKLDLRAWDRWLDLAHRLGLESLLMEPPPELLAPIAHLAVTQGLRVVVPVGSASPNEFYRQSWQDDRLSSAFAAAPGAGIAVAAGGAQTVGWIEAEAWRERLCTVLVDAEAVMDEAWLEALAQHRGRPVDLLVHAGASSAPDAAMVAGVQSLRERIIRLAGAASGPGARTSGSPTPTGSRCRAR